MNPDPLPSRASQAGERGSLPKSVENNWLLTVNLSGGQCPVLNGGRRGCRTAANPPSDSALALQYCRTLGLPVTESHQLWALRARAWRSPETADSVQDAHRGLACGCQCEKSGVTTLWRYTLKRKGRERGKGTKGKKGKKGVKGKKGKKGTKRRTSPGSQQAYKLITANLRLTRN